MKSVWTQLVLLLVYLLLVFLISRLLDIVLWYQHGISPTQTLDPLLLSVGQLKHLLENRGVSYTGYVEKKELAELVEASAPVTQGEVGELGPYRPPATPPPATHFSGGAHLYEEVEDTKDSVWLVQVVAGGEPLLDDYTWRVVRSQVARLAVRTGLFDCRHDRRLCEAKGWHHSLLLLALPKGGRAKDRVVLETSTATRPQAIAEWIRGELSVRVRTISDTSELEKDWLPSNTSSRDVRVLLLSHLLHPPLFLAALAIKFTGRVRFGAMTVRREDAGKLRAMGADLRTPCLLVVTPERRVVYGHRKGEHHTFAAVNALLRAVQPETNDMFLVSLALVNMLVTLRILQMPGSLWWHHVARCLWLVVSYNLWLFATWLLLLACCRFSLVAFLADKALVVVRGASLSDMGSLVRSDLQMLVAQPYLLLGSFLAFAVGARILRARRAPSEGDGEGAEGGRPWWEVLPPGDSYWVNCLFRPMASLSRPLPPTEVELEEGIELLIERLAVPTLWLQPVVPPDYIKDLPVWRFRGWGGAEVERIMDGEDPRWVCCTCLVRWRRGGTTGSPRCKGQTTDDQGVEGPTCACTASETDSGDDSSTYDPPAGVRPASECPVCLETYRRGALLCGLPCGHAYHQCCIIPWLARDNHNCPVCRWPAYKSRTHRD